MLGKRRGASFPLAIATFIVMLSMAVPAFAVPVSFVRVESDVDWTSAGVGGIGAGGTGTITLTGVSGTVTKAFLYWHGINNPVYNNPNVTINGNAVTGVTLGDATTNCWGTGSSRAFRADVTAFVPGNGSYTVAGLSSGGNANGASLVVVYDDGNATNNRDLVFFEGNDSSFPAGFPGEDVGWNGSLTPINYGGGPVAVQLHVGDGQNFGGGAGDDGALTFTTSNGNQVFPDPPGRFDGSSVPSAGNSRASNGNLWDIATLDITSAFGGVPGNTTLTITAPSMTDCLALIVLLVDLEPGTAPPPPGVPVILGQNLACGSAVAVLPGITVAFQVDASSTDAQDVITLDATGVPPAAILSPPLPAVGNPVSTSFSWTPTAADANTQSTITFTATDTGNQTDTCIFTIAVADELFIELASFTATPGDSRVLLEWETALEIDNAGFYLVRRDVVTGEVVRLNRGLISAQGDIVQGASYRFEDETAINGVEYQYGLVDVDLSGLDTRHPDVFAVANPATPPIHLVLPAYGAQLAFGDRPTFRWESSSARRLTMLISTDPTFSDRARTIVLSVPGGDGESTLKPRAGRELEALAGQGLGVLYWRIVEHTVGSLVNTSETFRFGYSAGASLVVAEPGEPSLDRREIRRIRKRR